MYIYIYIYIKHPSKSVSTKVIITFLSLVLTLNNFIINRSHYLQVMGCAMDTIYAPAYTNIFMSKLHYFYDTIHRQYFHDLEWNYRGTTIIHR